MKPFTPYKKLSKKSQRALNQKKRVTWGTLNPVTRKPSNPRAYDRNRQSRRLYPDDPTQ